MPLWRASAPLVLASKSLARRTMLGAAGIPVEVVPPDIDERAVERARGGTLDPGEIALLLAWEKASAVSHRLSGRLVLGADQTLALGEQRFLKPSDSAQAREQLQALSGKTHRLHSALALVRDGSLLFKSGDTATLTMRNLSGDFLDSYLDAAGDFVTESVGGYQLEKLGVHLFERVEGNHFTILGMPLMPLLDFLRHEKMLAG